LWLSGAVHGDEMDGVEIIRQVLAQLDPARMAGTVYAAPIVNVFGFVSESRYLPDRKDLNRSFPGSMNGSLAARLAHLFLTEVVDRCDFGLDFHCAATDRVNLPQVRGDLDDAQTEELAQAFGAPVSLHSKPPAGSLRGEAVRRGKRVLVYEGGESRRFTSASVRAGVEGTNRVLAHLGMIDSPASDAPPTTVLCRHSRWVRASDSGICRLDLLPGDRVSRGQHVGVISDAFGERTGLVKARASGVVIGTRLSPLVTRGEALVHIAVDPE